MNSGWSRIEIAQKGKSFALTGVATCGSRWEAALVPTRVEALSRGRELASFLDCALVDATTVAARLPAESRMRSQRWGG